MISREDVAQALNVSDNSLCATLYGLKLRRFYRSFDIKKRGSGKREISAPPPALLRLQRRLYHFLLTRYVAKPCVHGFVREKSIVSNARRHVGQRYVINLDLAHFFPTIHFGRVRGVFQRPPFSFGHEAAEVMAQICCRADGALPQGGAISPLVSNLICRGLDTDLIRLAQQLRCRYTRYADDITFSTHRSSSASELVAVSDGIARATTPIVELIEKHGFTVNTSKVTLKRRDHRQKVTGIVVNEFPNVSRRFVRQIQGALYAWAKHGYLAANRRYQEVYLARDGGGADLENVLRGRLAYLKMVRGDTDCLYRRSVRRFNRLSERRIDITPIEDVGPCPLRGASPKSGGWSDWFARYSPSVFLVEVQTQKGDIFGGSAFHIGHGILATAGHNLIGQDGEPWPRIAVKSGADLITAAIFGTPYKGPRSRYPDVGALRVLESADRTLLPTQSRLPECGEEVAAIGFPTIPQRHSCIVIHVGVVEALPVCYRTGKRFIQVSFQSGGGLSGGCLIDKAGYVVGIMVENVFMGPTGAPQRPYGQAVPIEYFEETCPDLWCFGDSPPQSGDKLDVADQPSRSLEVGFSAPEALA